MTASLADLTPPSHAVQFYTQDDHLYANVGRFIAEGLKRGEHLVVVSSRAHRDGYVRQLPNVDALGSGRFVLLDAEELLSQFMVGPLPDRARFRAVIGQVFAELPIGVTPVRAFGEMVDLLWRSGNSNAALQLEGFWNEAIEERRFSLLCAYAMNNFVGEKGSTGFLDVCRNHSHVFSDGENGDSFEHVARTQAQADVDCALDEFLGILSHDLRSPLNTILITARTLVTRTDLNLENQERLDRILASGVRMQRMIDQLLDLTSARLSTGISIIRGPELDLAQVVLDIVEELREAAPGRLIALQATSCPASVDVPRFEQVVATLIGNAVVDADNDRPITVSVSARGALARTAVHHFGPPLRPEVEAGLFELFGSGRLGLGLYLAKRIIDAHEGRIEVASSLEQGTRFEVTFPRFV